jgi:hypothetical protein
VIETTPIPHLRQDLHRRVELIPMDRWCADITVALYLLADGRTAVVHSYSARADAPDRLEWLAAGMRQLADMAGAGRSASFACGTWHERAARRAFLEAAKPDPTVGIAARMLSIHDPRTDQQVTVTPLGGGAYRVAAVAADPAVPSRAPAVAAGLAKLADLDADPADDTVVRFPCGASHDALVALLLPRAINVRAALREQEMAAARGILVAPSQQAGPDG